MGTGSAITIVAPQSIQESEQLSEKLARSGLMPDALRGKPGDVMATILTGAEMGLAPMQALRSIQIIKGKATLSADLMGALVKKAKDTCSYLRLVESTPQRACYETQRVGEPKPTTMSFSSEDAQRAGLNGDNWRKYPAAMLRARCLSAICRAVYPDLCLGLYDSDSGELSDGTPPLSVVPPPAQVERDVTPTPTPQKSSRTASVAARVAQAVEAKAGPIVDVGPGQTEEAEALYRRRDAIVDRAKGFGFEAEGFRNWIGSTLGSRKALKAWDGADCAKLEAALAAMEPPADASPDAQGVA